jgi:ABC-type Zn2+ transport system substrate-binding protein/surface adhesin
MRLCILLLCLHSATLTAAPRVVTSIAPVFELTTAIMTGVAEPGLIIEGDASGRTW